MCQNFSKCKFLGDNKIEANILLFKKRSKLVDARPKVNVRHAYISDETSICKCNIRHARVGDGIRHQNLGYCLTFLEKARNSRALMFFKIGVLKNLANFTTSSPGTFFKRNFETIEKVLKEAFTKHLWVTVT